MNTSSRVEAVLRYLSGKSDFNIHGETTLAGDLELDSLDLIEAVVCIENEFAIDIPDADVDEPALGTFGGLVAYVQGKIDADPDRERYGTMKIPAGIVISHRGVVG